MIGKRFGRLVVVASSDARDSNGRIFYVCACDCGSKCTVRGTYLRDGRTKSCGCLARELSSKRNKTHGLTKHPLYPTWGAMMRRCYDIKDRAYERYGGRGIGVCKRWHSAEKFVSDNAKKAAPGLSIDRIDNDGHYEPSNVRWVSCGTQSRNRRSNVLLTHKGQTQTLTEWAEALSIPPRTLWARIRRRGWSVDKALSTPVRK